MGNIFKSMFGSKTVDQTSKSTPWEPTIPAWQQGITASQNWAGQAPSANQTGAWGKVQSAYDPSTWMQGGNPYMQSMIDRANEDTTKAWQRANTPYLNQQSFGSGRMLGSNRAQMLDTTQSNLKKALEDTQNQFRYQDYNQRLGMMPQVGQMYSGSVQEQEQDKMRRQQMLADFLSKTGGGTQVTPMQQQGWGPALLGTAASTYGAYKMLTAKQPTG